MSEGERRPEVSVVIPARNAAATIGSCLAALYRQRAAPAFETIVVDDGSTDATAAIVRGAGTRVRLISRGPVGGAGAARNLGVAQATAPLIAFTDADCEPDPDWLRHGCSALKEADLVQGAVEPAHPPAGPFDHTLSVNRPGYFETANLMVRRGLFERVGGFEDWLERGSGRPIGEDTWFGWSARRAGAETRFDPRCLVRHAVIPGDARGHVLERVRLRHFPEIVKRIPELRRARLHRQLFLNQRTSAFDLGLVGLAAAAATRRRWPGLAAAPYGWMLIFEARRAGKERIPLVAPIDLLADLIGCGSLLYGTVRSRSPVL